MKNKSKGKVRHGLSTAQKDQLWRREAGRVCSAPHLDSLFIAVPSRDEKGKEVQTWSFDPRRFPPPADTSGMVQCVRCGLWIPRHNLEKSWIADDKLHGVCECAIVPTAYEEALEVEREKAKAQGRRVSSRHLPDKLPGWPPSPMALLRTQATVMRCTGADSQLKSEERQSIREGLYDREATIAELVKEQQAEAKADRKAARKVREWSAEHENAVILRKNGGLPL